jgi:hypothetical protein
MTASNGPEARRVAKVEREWRMFKPLRRLFLIDVFTDKASRPNLLWAGTTLLIGTVVYHWLEGWNYLDSLYFCVITLATVGYGDFHPTTPEARLFTIVYVINGIGILLALFDRIRVVRQRSIADELDAPNPGPPEDAPTA